MDLNGKKKGKTWWGLLVEIHQGYLVRIDSKKPEDSGKNFW